VFALRSAAFRFFRLLVSHCKKKAAFAGIFARRNRVLFTMLAMSWIVLALLSFLLMGVGNFLIKLAANAGQPSVTILTLIFLTDVIVAGTLLIVRKPDFAWSVPAVGWSIAAGLFLGFGLYFMIVAMSMPEAKTGIVAALMNANFVLVSLLGFVLLQETLTLKQVAGLAAVLGGMLLLL